MSQRYLGGFITANPVAPSQSSAKGEWTLQQQMQAKAASNWPFGGPFTYIEDVFSTYLYTGNGSAQAINNGIDLAGKGGMVWTKSRTNTRDNNIVDTVRGGDNMVYTNQTIGQFSLAGLGFSPFTFGSSGYTYSNAPVDAQNNQNYASWTFRKQPKFFDVVTFTAPGFSNVTVNHNLGSVPGMVLIKSTSDPSNWYVWHRSIPNDYMFLNSTAASASGAVINTVTSSSFIFDGANWNVGSNTTWVAYLFAHNAGGFGTSGTDNVISCGSFVSADSSGGVEVNLGYEPQYVLVKTTGIAYKWVVFDVMRGMPVSTSAAAGLSPNNSDAEAFNLTIYPTATGFKAASAFGDGYTFIYMAIRRPMKVPTDATTVFSPVLGVNASAGSLMFNTGFATDGVIEGWRTNTIAAINAIEYSRLQGNYQYLQTSATTAEQNDGGYRSLTSNQGVVYNTSFNGTNELVGWCFARRPGFFDEVCYTGDGVGGRTVTHNLGVAPEFIIVKSRSASDLWIVYTQPTGASGVLQLASTAALVTPYFNWNPTSTTFSVGAQTYSSNNSGVNYVAYLFASCPGVSKVGSYTGTGALQNINCGFTGGARFVLIKRTDSTSNWFVWDTARGMTAGTDPSLSLNTTAAEVNANSAYTNTGGFQLLASPAANVNTNGGSYIFLAIA